MKKKLILLVLVGVGLAAVKKRRDGRADEALWRQATAGSSR